MHTHTLTRSTAAPPSGDAETIKAYVRQHSMLLSLAPNKEKAKMVVKKEGEFYLVDDVARDVRPRVKVKRIQLVKSMLGGS